MHLCTVLKMNSVYVNQKQQGWLVAGKVGSAWALKAPLPQLGQLYHKNCEFESVYLSP